MTSGAALRQLGEQACASAPGRVCAVVVTTPRSVKIMLRRAPASSIARMSRRSETPVALKRVDDEAAVAHRLHEGAGGGGLARVHAGADEGDDRHAVGVERRGESSGSWPMRAGTPMRSPRNGK